MISAIECIIKQYLESFELINALDDDTRITPEIGRVIVAVNCIKSENWSGWIRDIINAPPCAITVINAKTVLIIIKTLKFLK